MPVAGSAAVATVAVATVVATADLVLLAATALVVLVARTVLVPTVRQLVAMARPVLVARTVVPPVAGTITRRTTASKGSSRVRPSSSTVVPRVVRVVPVELLVRARVVWTPPTPRRSRRRGRTTTRRWATRPVGHRSRGTAPGTAWPADRPGL